MQARMKALLAEHDRKATEHLIELQGENEDLRREVESLGKMLNAKESLISVINAKRDVRHDETI